MMQPACKKYFCTAFVTVVLAVFSLRSSAQDVPFIPPVYNYTTGDYKADNQNWAIAQGSNGVIYFGNNNGLLSFDGVNWDLHHLPNNLSVKSIFIDSGTTPERIYVGSFEEFGYFEPDETNQLIYHSIKSLAKDYPFHNDEVWTIYPFNDKIYFQSFSAIFAYNGEQVMTLKPYPAVLYFFPVGEKLYAQLINSDLCRFDGERFHTVLKRDRINDDNIVSMLQFGNEYLLVTSKSGLYRFSEEKELLTPWETELDEELKEAIINRAIVADSTQCILGTINNGLYAFNREGKMLWNINKDNGLNNNTILALFSDNKKSIWAALDNGISNIRTPSPLSIFEPTDIQIGLVEDILFHEDDIFLATNQGVYSYSSSNKSFLPLPEFDVQSWFIKKFGKQLFVGHNLGTSMLENRNKIPVSEVRTGGTDMKEVTINGKRILLESTYTFLYVYSQDNSGMWRFSHQIDGFSDLIKNIEVDHTGNIWADHMYKGVYRLRLDRTLHNVVEIENFLSLDTTRVTPLRPIKLMKLKGRIIFTDGSNFFTYDDIQQEIVPFDQLNNDLPGFADTYRIVPFTNNLFWFIRNNEYSLVEFKEDRYILKDRIPYNILNNPPNVGRANVYVSDSDISYFSLNGGIGKYSFREKGETGESRLQFSSIENYSRDNEESIYLNPQEKGVIVYRNNNLDFRFSYPEFSKKAVTVESLLEGYDNRWVSTNENLSISYNNLPANDYILNARVLDSSGTVLSTVSYTFQIKNPWYKTGWSWLSYILLILLISGLIIKTHIQKIIRKKNRAFAEQENRRLSQIEEQEKQITRLRNEKLEADLIHKGKELASATMMIINHSEFLKKVYETIQQYILEGKINRNEGKALLSMIGDNLNTDDEWTIFQENFDLIHENFFRKLKEQYPSLTSTDLKLCTLLRLNYSTKEIAKLLNISVRGVESARYRLRKKLDLSENDDLVDFIIGFH